MAPFPTGTPDRSAHHAELLESARKAATRAYVPYSHFPVGAALLTRSGRVIQGCNVENASFGLTICAERTAATRMIAESAASGGTEGNPDRLITTVAVVGLKASPCFPCGACRQVLNEFGCTEVVVEEDGRLRVYPFAELLPHSFGPSDLDVAASAQD